MDSTLMQKTLVAEVAVAISQFMQVSLPSGTDEHGFISHSFQGPFDENCYTLWELGAAWAAPRSGGRGLTLQEWGDERGVGPSAFKFMPPAETHAIIMAHREITSSLVFRILESYLRSMEDYGWHGSHLYVGREPFEPARIFKPQIEALIECGYLTRSGTMVSWTDQIGPAMQAAHYWDTNLNVPLRHSINLPIEVLADVERMIQCEQRIAAIAAIRSVADVEIFEAKVYVENLERSMTRRGKVKGV
jgi:hypothetical protein